MADAGGNGKPAGLDSNPIRPHSAQMWDSRNCINFETGLSEFGSF